MDETQFLMAEKWPRDHQGPAFSASSGWKSFCWNSEEAWTKRFGGHSHCTNTQRQPRGTRVPVHSLTFPTSAHSILIPPTIRKGTGLPALWSPRALLLQGKEWCWEIITLRARGAWPPCCVHSPGSVVTASLPRPRREDYLRSCRLQTHCPLLLFYTGAHPCSTFNVVPFLMTCKFKT